MVSDSDVPVPSRGQTLTARRVTIALGLVLLLALAALAAVEAGAPVGGISRGEAIDAAQRAVNSTAQTGVDWAFVAPLLFFRGGAGDEVAPPLEIVWAVRLRGTFPPASCGPVPQPGQKAHCPPPDHTATVMLDYRSGRFVMATIEP